MQQLLLSRRVVARGDNQRRNRPQLTSRNIHCTSSVGLKCAHLQRTGRAPQIQLCYAGIGARYAYLAHRLRQYWHSEVIFELPLALAKNVHTQTKSDPAALRSLGCLWCCNGGVYTNRVRAGAGSVSPFPPLTGPVSCDSRHTFRGDIKSGNITRIKKRVTPLSAGLLRAASINDSSPHWSGTKGLIQPATALLYQP
jgi:hypothetical protein